MRAMRTIVFLLIFGLVFYYLETGCAGTGKQELWELCAQEIHQDCWGAEDVLDCGYQHYRKCIDGS